MNTENTDLELCEAFEKVHPGSVYSATDWVEPAGISAVRTYPYYNWAPIVKRTPTTMTLEEKYEWLMTQPMNSFNIFGLRLMVEIHSYEDMRTLPQGLGQLVADLYDAKQP